MPEEAGKGVALHPSLIWAKKTRVRSQIAPLLDTLQQSGFRLSECILQDALRVAEEGWKDAAFAASIPRWTPYGLYTYISLKVNRENHASPLGVEKRLPTPFFLFLPVQTIIEYLEGGQTIDDFLEGFPTVTRAQVIAFLEEAKDRMVTAVRWRFSSTSASTVGYCTHFLPFFGRFCYYVLNRGLDDLERVRFSPFWWPRVAHALVVRATEPGDHGWRLRAISNLSGLDLTVQVYWMNGFSG